MKFWNVFTSVAVLTMIAIHRWLPTAGKSETSSPPLVDVKPNRPSHAGSKLKVLEPAAPRSRSLVEMPRVPDSNDPWMTAVSNSFLSSQDAKTMFHRTAIASFLESPARDTPECRQILAILTINGYDIGLLKQCYTAAYELSMVDPTLPHPTAIVNGEPFDTRNAEHVKAYEAFQEADYFMNSQRLMAKGMPEQVVSQILSVRPCVFWGNGRRPENQSEGQTTKSNTDEELNRYLSEHIIETAETQNQ